jgi:hypothetical protein
MIGKNRESAKSFPYFLAVNNGGAMKLVRLCLMVLVGFILYACSANPTVTAPAAVPAGSQAPQPQAQATSRGDKLEASPPASVKFGAGQPVLIEFFRFT